MTKRELKALCRYSDFLFVRDSLNLSDEERDMFNLLYHHGKSICQCHFDMHISMSKASKLSMEITRKLAQYNTDPRNTIRLDSEQNVNDK